MIRSANFDDIPALLTLGAQMHAESPGFGRHPFIPDKLRNIAEHLLLNAPGILLVAVRGDEIVGLMAGLVSEHFFSNAKMATDLAVYVIPEARGGMAGVALIKAFEKRAKELGADECQPGVSAGISDELAVELYERLGYTRRSIGMWKAL